MIFLQQNLYQFLYKLKFKNIIQSNIYKYIYYSIDQQFEQRRKKEQPIMKSVKNNERALKQKQKHMKSILSQVKNKNIIEELEISQKTNDFDILSYKPNWKDLENCYLITKRPVRTSRQVSFKKANQTGVRNDGEGDGEEGKENNKLGDQFTRQEVQEQQKEGRKHKKSSQPMRDSSRIELQLKQIMQYSQLYPSRNTSHKSLEKKISKIDNFRSKNQKNISVFPSEHQSQAASKSNQPDTNLTKSRFFRHRNYPKSPNITPYKIFQQNVLLDIVEDDGLVLDYQQHKIKKKQTRDLLKKSRNTTTNVTNTKPFDFSLTSFLQQEMNQLRSKAGRKTVGSHSKSSSSSDVPDIRNQNINDLHRFLRGQARDDEEISNYMTGKQIRKYQNKYQLYENIYKKTKEEFNNEKLDLNGIRELTVKHAIFLNQAYKQNNNWTRRQEILKTMKILNFYQ